MELARAIVRRLAVGAMSVFGFMCGLIAAVGAVLYMIPATSCDSQCWRNDTLTRAIGIFGLPLALATATVVPLGFKLARSHRLAAWLMVLTVAVFTFAWWSVSNRILGSARFV
jgi:hypothetical protein